MKAQTIPTTLTYSEDYIDGYNSITIEHRGCPVLTVYGLDDMGCVGEEDEGSVAASVVATADLIILSYNHHQELVARLYTLCNAIERDFPLTCNQITEYVDARETLKKVIQ